MPELPEVESTCNSLKPVIIGKTILNVVINVPKLRYSVPIELSSKVEGAIITNIYRHAKYIIINLNNDNSIIIHLGMSGRLTYSTNTNLKKHDHCIINLNADFKLIFNDPRRFGLIDYVTTPNLLMHKYFAKLGLEPLDNCFNAIYLKNKIVKSNSLIKILIMNSNIVVGVGNIYASESLFAAKISPYKLARELNNNEISNLVLSIKNILIKAIKAGGTSFKDYIAADGTKGSYIAELMVYGKQNDKCKICNSVIVKIKQAGRATFYCPTCQQ